MPVWPQPYSWLTQRGSRRLKTDRSVQWKNGWKRVIVCSVQRQLSRYVITHFAAPDTPAGSVQRSWDSYFQLQWWWLMEVLWDGKVNIGIARCQIDRLRGSIIGGVVSLVGRPEPVWLWTVVDCVFVWLWIGECRDKLVLLGSTKYKHIWHLFIS